MGTAFGVPGGSLDISWGAVTDAYKYKLRYTFTGQYPQYTDGPAPHALLQTQGITMATVDAPATSYEFIDGPPDIYSVSIWTLSLHGVMSATCNTDVISGNYYLGDFKTADEDPPVPNGCLEFGGEFGALAACYNTAEGDTYFNAYLDIAPTIDGTVEGYVVPDDSVNFDDLVFFSLNYRDYRCRNGGIVHGGEVPLKVRPSSDAAMTVEVPASAARGAVFTVPVQLNDGAGILGYHVGLSYDASALEVLSVTAGEACPDTDNSFLHYDVRSSYLDISSVVLGDVDYGRGDIALITVRSLVEGPIEMEASLVDIRDMAGQQADVAFSIHTSLPLPTAFTLSQNYPNPFNPTTNIDLALPVASDYKLTIYNMLGQEVESFDGFAEAGYKTLTWDASRQASGIYLYRVKAGNFTATRKMILLK
jgi:hypothetical protein